MSDRSIGFHNKYDVRRLGDTIGKHDDCSFFVLDLTHDQFAKMALVVYAMQCQERYPALATDLLDMVFGDTEQ
jgi:hypothetical protein